jgi:hypothetical protein
MQRASDAPSALSSRSRSIHVNAWARGLALLGLIAIAASCQSTGLRPPEDARLLEAGTSTEGGLHCARGRCDDWYRLVLRKREDVVIEADAPAHAALPDFGLMILTTDMSIVGDAREDRARPRRLQMLLAPGPYYVRVYALGENRDRLSYKLKFTRKQRAARRPARSSTGPRPAAAPTPPKPARQPAIESEVLEVERTGSEPTAVLLEASSSDGVRAGSKGVLLDAGGGEIGRIEIVDVYAAGSRARIIGGLSAPITLDTRAQIEP